MFFFCLNFRLFEANKDCLTPIQLGKSHKYLDAFPSHLQSTTRCFSNSKMSTRSLQASYRPTFVRVRQIQCPRSLYRRHNSLPISAKTSNLSDNPRDNYGGTERMTTTKGENAENESRFRIFPLKNRGSSKLEAPEICLSHDTQLPLNLWRNINLKSFRYA